MAGRLTPGAEGRYIYTARGVFTTEGKPVGKTGSYSDGSRYSLPAADSESFYLRIDVPGFPHGANQPGTLHLHTAGDDRGGQPCRLGDDSGQDRAERVADVAPEPVYTKRLRPPRWPRVVGNRRDQGRVERMPGTALLLPEAHAVAINEPVCLLDELLMFVWMNQRNCREAGIAAQRHTNHE